MLRNKKGSQIAANAVDMEESRTSDVPKDVEVKKQTSAEKAIAQLYENINENSDDLKHTCEIREKAQNALTKTPSAYNYLYSAEIKPCNTAEKKFIILQKL